MAESVGEGAFRLEGRRARRTAAGPPNRLAVHALHRDGQAGEDLLRIDESRVEEAAGSRGAQVDDGLRDDPARLGLAVRAHGHDLEADDVDHETDVVDMGLMIRPAETGALLLLGKPERAQHVLHVRNLREHCVRTALEGDACLTEHPDPVHSRFLLIGCLSSKSSLAYEVQALGPPMPDWKQGTKNHTINRVFCQYFTCYEDWVLVGISRFERETFTMSM